jgi:hypothetical protein
MKATNEGTGHNRTIRLTGLPGTNGTLTELTITVNYTNTPNDGSTLDKAVTLDSVVIPELLRAINATGQLDTFFSGLKPNTGDAFKPETDARPG